MTENNPVLEEPEEKPLPFAAKSNILPVTAPITFARCCSRVPGRDSATATAGGPPAPADVDHLRALLLRAPTQNVTYAARKSVDETVAAGRESGRFSRPAEEFEDLGVGA